MEEWGLGPEDIARIDPRTILARVSGYGQTGPYTPKPGYASVAEGYGGLRYVTGFPDQPPARANLSLGDSIAGLHAALGILTAVYHRDVNGGAGQVVDVAIVEGIFNLMESMVPEFTSAGIVRERHGSKVSGIVPSSTYPCADGKYIIVGGNGDSIFKRLMRVVGRADLAEDPRVARNDGRVTHEAEIDEAIEAWTRARPFAEVLATLEAAGVPAGPISRSRIKSPTRASRPAACSRGAGRDRKIVDAAGARAASRRHAGRHGVARSAVGRAQRRGLPRRARPRRRGARRAADDGSNLMALKLMAVLAHADNESLGFGGTLASLCRGRRRDIAGHGDARRGGAMANISADRRASGPEALARMRKGELRAAATVLGISDIAFLDYRDRSSITPNHAGGGAHGPSAAADGPDVVLTFGQDSATGIRIGRDLPGRDDRGGGVRKMRRSRAATAPRSIAWRRYITSPGQHRRGPPMRTR